MQYLSKKGKLYCNKKLIHRTGKHTYSHASSTKPIFQMDCKWYWHHLKNLVFKAGTNKRFCIFVAMLHQHQHQHQQRSSAQGNRLKMAPLFTRTFFIYCTLKHTFLSLFLLLNHFSHHFLHTTYLPLPTFSASYSPTRAKLYGSLSQKSNSLEATNLSWNIFSCHCGCSIYLWCEFQALKYTIEKSVSGKKVMVSIFTCYFHQPR